MFSKDLKQGTMSLEELVWWLNFISFVYVRPLFCWYFRNLENIMVSNDLKQGTISHFNNLFGGYYFWWSNFISFVYEVVMYGVCVAEFDSPC
jgi:hypothetical protein